MHLIAQGSAISTQQRMESTASFLHVTQLSNYLAQDASSAAFRGDCPEAGDTTNLRCPNALLNTLLNIEHAPALQDEVTRRHSPAEPALGTRSRTRRSRACSRRRPGSGSAILCCRSGARGLCRHRYGDPLCSCAGLAIGCCRDCAAILLPQGLSSVAPARRLPLALLRCIVVPLALPHGRILLQEVLDALWLCRHGVGVLRLSPRRGCWRS